MKVLMLTYPYNGGQEIGGSLASDCGYQFIYDPFEPRPTTYTNPLDGGQIVDPKLYNYGDNVQNNTLTVVNVGWHERNPQNLSHTDFLNGLRVKFNRIFCLMTNNIEFNWKLYCSSKHKDLEQGENSNYWWTKWNLQSCYEYDESHFNQTHKNRILNAHQVLSDYKDQYNLSVILREDIFPIVTEDGGTDPSANINCNPTAINQMFETLDIGWPALDPAMPENAFYTSIRHPWDNKF